MAANLDKVRQLFDSLSMIQIGETDQDLATVA